LKPTRAVQLFIPITFDGEYHVPRDDGIRPSGLWQERAKRTLLKMWEDTEPARLFMWANWKLQLWDYYIRPNANSIGPDIRHAEVLYRIEGLLSEDDLVYLIMKFNAFTEQPDLPYFDFK
jgi:hypothetical protein